MSMDARGKFAGALVFSGWKGRPTVRQLVTPANPKSIGQETARNQVRVAGAGQHFANFTTQKRATHLTTDKAELSIAAPSGQAWNGFLVKSEIGTAGISYTAATGAYTALTAPQKATWDVAAAALVPAIPAVAQKGAGGVPAAAMAAGEVFFHYVYGLYVAGVQVTVPGAVPPVYA